MVSPFSTALTQSGMILSLAKSPPPITLPALDVETATLPSVKNDFCSCELQVQSKIYCLNTGHNRQAAYPR